ncbi:MAG: restriction endonuclease subunit S [Dehalococcoidia bacterium]
MSGWRAARLGEVLESVRRPVAIRPGELYETLGLRWYGAGCFVKSGTPVKAKTMNRVSEGDVVYSKLFAWKGSFGVVSEAEAGAVASTEFPTFRSNEDHLLPGYFAFWSGRSEVWDEADALSTGTTGNSRNRLSPEAFLDLEIHLPPLAEQLRMVRVVDGIRRATAAVRVEAATAEAVARALYLDAIGSGDTAEALFEDFASLDVDYVVVAEDSYYRVAGVAIAGGGLFWQPTLRGADTRYAKLHRLTSGSLVYRKLTAWEGPIAVVPSEFEGAVVSPEFPTLKVDRELIDLDFLSFLCRQPALHAEMRANSTGTAERRNRLKPADLLQVSIDLPSRQRQREIGAVARLSQTLMGEASAYDALASATRESYLSSAA